MARATEQANGRHAEVFLYALHHSVAGSLLDDGDVASKIAKDPRPDGFSINGNPQVDRSGNGPACVVSVHGRDAQSRSGAYWRRCVESPQFAGCNRPDLDAKERFQLLHGLDNLMFHPPFQA